MAQEVPKNKDESLNLKITCKSHVKPEKKIGRKECQLVTFDLPYLAFYYNQKILFYKGDGDFEGMVKKLKDGLSIVLEEFHQLAGKIGKDEEGVFKVEYDDDMEGVEVTEAVLGDEIGVADLTVAESTEILKELIPYSGVLNLEGMHRPLLAIQLTKLKDGLAMGCAFNHAVLDGTSTWHFMSSWAEICSGSPSTSTSPFLDRTKARNTRVKLDLSLPEPKGQPNGDAKPEPKLREKIFKFSESTIDKIKSTVNENSSLDSSKPFSTFQALSTHIWHHVTHARNLKPEDYTVFTVFVDCRKRVNPPMPEAYFGNLIQAIFTVTAAGLLLAQPPQFGASLIQKAIVAHNAKAIDERNKEWESSPKIFQFKDAGVNCVAVGSSPRFKVYDINFGWGNPENVRSGTNNKFDGMIYLYPGKNGGRSIDVELTLEPEAMGRLEQDKEFLMEV
ncbi:PREDICTED: BAHD acyltransferase DCR isoform X3 [Lupinus angustifolius]|uniref:BAHD acyltransferase DCR isoform X2 n=1 Tax=Lupinus angustifolius TaxID=3871 RepID=UPI00092E5D2D|nr:PREDICTED: BAHD acyltransferase DCR isoform X2 [Lupinus angustifolius]XP_019430620.1 PREDICTED: BAHD acyltransferase DCR isoform X3 [Lupinus angustifolius]